MVTAAANAARGSTGWLALVHPIQASALFAAMIFLLVSRPRLRELLVFLLGAVGFAVAHRAWIGFFHYRGVPLAQSQLVAAGLASLLALAIRAAADGDDEAWAWLHLAVVLPAFGMAMGLCLDLTIALHARAWDPVLLRLDAGLGQPSFAVGRVAAAHPWLLTLLGLVYLFLPLVMAAIIATERRQAAPVAPVNRPVLRAILLAAVVGYALYNIYPVVGPSPLFGDRFPFGSASLPGAARLIDVTGIDEPRNCMPSLHVAWALLIYWHARPLGPLARAGCACWLVLTVLATLAMGQHYLVDLVVAVPFAVLIDVLASLGAPVGGGGQRRHLVIAAVALLVGWYAILFWAPPAASRGPTIALLALVTVLPSWVLHNRWAARLPA